MMDIMDNRNKCGTTYKSSGVNVKYGDAISKFFYDVSKTSWDIRKDIGKIIKPEGNFSGVRYIDVSNLPEGTVMGSNFDGIGTKVEFAERFGCYFGLGRDLLAMVCGDSISYGSEPILIGSILDVDKIHTGDLNSFNGIGFKALASGLLDAAKEANVAIINGEIAELGNRINGKPVLWGPALNWGATCIWFAKKDNLIDTTTIRPGDSLVGLEEYGFRSNGFSLLRKIYKDTNFICHGRILGEILTPSTIYTKAIVGMTGGYSGEKKVDIHGIAHITGGGLYGKMKRILKPNKLGAIIDDPFNPPSIALESQKRGRVSDKEAYRTWNMGQGMVIITPEPTKTIEIAESHGKTAKIIGKVTEDETIFIRNRGSYARTEFLEFRD